MLQWIMANGIPVRLSEALTVRARTAAETLDRSLTEQVEHWARLGQVVEDAILAATVQRLKARSHDAELSARLARPKTADGRAKAIELIRSRNPVRHGLDSKVSARARSKSARGKTTRLKAG
jgi:hypothetical protein